MQRTDKLHSELLEELAELIKSSNFFEFAIHSYRNSVLTLMGGFDIAYSHEVEIRFYEVSFVSLPTDFSMPRISIATADDRRCINKLVALDSSEVVFRIDAATSRPTGAENPFFVVAEEMKVITGTVYHYERENLKAGERVDDEIAGKRPEQTEE